MNQTRQPSPETVATHLAKCINSQLTEGHVCNFKTCKIDNLKIEIHRNGDVYGIRAPYVKTPTWITSETLVDTIYSIYLCRNSGKIHYCHVNCDGDRITNAENCQVCCVSGIQYQSEAARSWKVESRCVASVVANKQDPYMYSREQDGSVRLSGVHNMKTKQCLMIARETIHTLLFSQDRIRNERRKIDDVRKEADKLVNRYKRYTERHKQPLIYMNMITIYVAHIKKKPSHAHLIYKSKTEQDVLINKYASQLIGYWKTVLFRTSLGKEMPSLFQFKSFAPACLYIMKLGLCMHGVYIIEHDRYLDAALPEANSLDVYGISKPAFTQSKNNVLRAVREIIEARKETPTNLRNFGLAESAKVKP